MTVYGAEKNEKSAWLQSGPWMWDREREKDLSNAQIMAREIQG